MVNSWGLGLCVLPCFSSHGHKELQVLYSPLLSGWPVLCLASHRAAPPFCTDTPPGNLCFQHRGVIYE
jgi:hypothetical protein